MKTLVVYYSNKGSNTFLAKKISQSLSCELEQIRPRLNIFLLFLMKIHLGIKPIKRQIKDYDRIVLCGPIWIGRLIPPLRSFINKYLEDINNLIFVTCCGSSYEQKDEKMGHNNVFKEVKKIAGNKRVLCQAFPIGLVLPDEKKDDSDAFMKTHLNNDNFEGEMLEHFNEFISKIKE